jgi:hypothetical protein
MSATANLGESRSFAHNVDSDSLPNCFSNPAPRARCFNEIVAGDRIERALAHMPA